jgi:GntR family transcriptional regulator
LRTGGRAIEEATEAAAGGTQLGVEIVKQLSRENADPLWMQLMRVLREDIRSGGLQADQALPSETELTELFGVSRPVVREALRELAQERVIYKIKGKGTFVAPRKTEVNFIGSVAGSADDLRPFGRRVATHIIKQQLAPADEWEATLLEIPTGTPVVRLRRLRSVDGQAWLLTTAALPAELVPGLEQMQLENRSLYDVLRRMYSLAPAGADRWVEAVFPTVQDAKLLDVDTRTPLLGIESVSWLPDGTRFEVYYALHRSDRMRFYIGVRRPASVESPIQGLDRRADSL